MHNFICWHFKYLLELAACLLMDLDIGMKKGLLASNAISKRFIHISRILFAFYFLAFKCLSWFLCNCWHWGQKEAVFVLFLLVYFGQLYFWNFFTMFWALFFNRRNLNFFFYLHLESIDTLIEFLDLTFRQLYFHIII